MDGFGHLNKVCTLLILIMSIVHPCLCVYSLNYTLIHV